MARLSLFLFPLLLNVFPLLDAKVSSDCVLISFYSGDLWLKAPSLVEPNPIAKTNEEKTGVLVKAAAFWIGLPEKENSMAFLKLAAGTKVKVLDMVDKYYKIRHRALIGYVKKELIKIIEPEEELASQDISPDRSSSSLNQVSKKKEEKAPPVSSSAENNFHVIKATSLRAGPDHRTKVYVRLPAGGKVKVLEASGKWWWKVSYKGKVGWAKCALLKKTD